MPLFTLLLTFRYAIAFRHAFLQRSAAATLRCHAAADASLLRHFIMLPFRHA